MPPHSEAMQSDVLLCDDARDHRGRRNLHRGLDLADEQKAKSGSRSGATLRCLGACEAKTAVLSLINADTGEVRSRWSPT